MVNDQNKYYRGGTSKIVTLYMKGEKKFDLNKIYGTCTVNTSGPGVLPHWVWTNEAGTKLDYTDSRLPSCTVQSDCTVQYKLPSCTSKPKGKVRTRRYACYNEIKQKH